MKSYFHIFLSIIFFCSCKQTYVEEKVPSSFNGKFKTNRDWWPNQLDLSGLRRNSDKSDPMGKDFNYKTAFNSLDYYELKKDLSNLLT